MASSEAATTTSRLILRPITATPTLQTGTAALMSTTSLVVVTSLPDRFGGSPNAAAIAGGIIGGLMGLGIIGLLVLECFIRQRWKLLRPGATSTAPTSDNAALTTGDVFGGSSQGTTVIASHGDNDMRRMSQVSETSGGSGQKVRFEGTQTVTVANLV